MSRTVTTEVAEYGPCCRCLFCMEHFSRFFCCRHAPRHTWADASPGEWERDSTWISFHFPQLPEAEVVCGTLGCGDFREKPKEVGRRPAR